jgi:hypothetical protein
MKVSLDFDHTEKLSIRDERALDRRGAAPVPSSPEITSLKDEVNQL